MSGKPWYQLHWNWKHLNKYFAKKKKKKNQDTIIPKHHKNTFLTNIE